MNAPSQPLVRLCPSCAAATRADETLCWLCHTRLPPYEERPLEVASRPARESTSAPDPELSGADELPAPSAQRTFLGNAGTVLLALLISIVLLGLALQGACGVALVLAVLLLGLMLKLTAPGNLGERDEGVLTFMRVLLVIGLVLVSLVVLLFLACTVGGVGLGNMH